MTDIMKNGLSRRAFLGWATAAVAAGAVCRLLARGERR
ncbi:MAG: twin-arginine translocation signal domain-containing protein [Eggerthella lenta]